MEPIPESSPCDYAAVIRNAVVCLDLPGTAKTEVLKSLVELLASDKKVSDGDAILDAVLARERKMSTGLQDGIALPHCKTMDVDDLAVAVGLAPGGIDFDSLDGEPTRILILVVASVLQVEPHLKFLGEVSERLSRVSVRERLLGATCEDAVRSILLNGGETDA